MQKLYGKFADTLARMDGKKNLQQILTEIEWDLGFIFSNLTVKEYDADGRVKNIRQITAGDFELAKAGIVSIVTSLGDAISGPEVMKALNSAEDLSKKALEKLKLLVDPVSGMVEAAQGLAEILQKNKDYFNADKAGTSQFSNGLKSVVSAFSALVDKEGPLNEKKLDVFSSRDFAKAMDMLKNNKNK